METVKSVTVANERENVHVSDPTINGKLIASVVT